MKRLLAALLICLAGSAWAGRLILLGAGPTMVGAATCSINLDFTTGGGSLPGSVSMSGAANAWHYASTGLLTKSGTNVARFDYDPTAKTLKGLLVEPAKTNGLINGGTDGWTTVAVNGGANALDPAGGTNAATYAENTANAEHHLTKNIPGWGVASQAVTFSFYFTNNSGARFLGVNFVDTSSYTGFLQGGVTPSTGAFDYGPRVGGTWTTPIGGTVQTISISGDTWFRASYGATVSAAGTLYVDAVWTSDALGTVFSYTGDGTSGFQLYGFMASKNSEKTLADSFIDTRGSGSPVTTTADTVTFSNPVCSQMTFTFDDNSTQTITGISAGTYTVPTNLNRPWIKTIVGAP